MKIRQSQLKKIIKEEMDRVLGEEQSIHQKIEQFSVLILKAQTFWDQMNAQASTSLHANPRLPASKVRGVGIYLKQLSQAVEKLKGANTQR